MLICMQHAHCPSSLSKSIEHGQEKVGIDQIPRWNLENRSKSTGLPSIEASTTASLACHTNYFVRFLFTSNLNCFEIAGNIWWSFFEARSIFENFPDLAPGDTGVRTRRQGTGLVLFFSTSLNICTSLTILFTLV